MQKCFLAAGALLAAAGLLRLGGSLRADDFVTLSGTAYHGARPVRAEPDGVTWQYDSGVVKVDFADCPESVRRAYHYDAARAAAYRDAQAATRRQADEQARQLVRAHEEHERARARLTLQNTAGTISSPDGGVFTLRRQSDAATTAALTALDEQALAKKTAHDLLTKDDGTLWDRRLWFIPSLIFGGYSPGNAFDPGTNLNPHEFRASLHHAPGGFAPDAIHDRFYVPDYLTKSYYEDIDRAEAFARGVPLGRP